MTDQTRPDPREAFVSLPFKTVLGWFMSSDPTPLKPEEDEAIRTILDYRAKELGFDGGWIDAFHRIDQFDIDALLPDVDAAVTALSKVVAAIHDFGAKKVRPGVPEWLLTAVTEADILVNNIQDAIRDPLNTGALPEDQIYAYPYDGVDPANVAGQGHGKQFPFRADAWYFQGEVPAHGLVSSGRWMAVVRDWEPESDWFEDETRGEDSWRWPTPRTYPITERPPFGTLLYRKMDGTEVTEEIVTA